jgi:hypothetical protein
MSYPWYELGEGQKVYLDPRFESVVETDGKVGVARGGPFEWHIKEKGF